MDVAPAGLLRAHPERVRIHILEGDSRRQLQRRRKQAGQPERSGPVNLRAEGLRKDAVSHLRRIVLVDDVDAYRRVVLLIRRRQRIGEGESENLERSSKRQCRDP